MAIFEKHLKKNDVEKYCNPGYFGVQILMNYVAHRVFVLKDGSDLMFVKTLDSLEKNTSNYVTEIYAPIYNFFSLLGYVHYGEINDAGDVKVTIETVPNMDGDILIDAAIFFWLNYEK